VHVDPACLASAVKRRVFGRALRVTGVIQANLVEAQLVEAHLTQVHSTKQHNR
jgi:hypothetical protein